jgi:hypothetical protein
MGRFFQVWITVMLWSGFDIPAISHGAKAPVRRMQTVLRT